MKCFPFSISQVIPFAFGQPSGQLGSIVAVEKSPLEINEGREASAREGVAAGGATGVAGAAVFVDLSGVWLLNGAASDPGAESKGDAS
ncbi:MAG: hypothetical protein WC661_11525 [Opitutaceae bacterium]